MAVRIARAASGRDKVAICGYHGWHDWYLAANLSSSESLDSHLLPGLSTKGVPRTLQGSAVTFAFNDLAGLREIMSGGDVGVIIMEVERSSAPAPGFLEAVRNLATENGAVLVFDESTSGFRRTLGGHHLTIGIDPDMAVFGKTLGNGYAITAVIGRDEVMDVARDLFLSSTFWTERIGPSAALAAIAAMEEDEAPARIDALGRTYRHLLSQAAESAGVPIGFSGLPALTAVSISTIPEQTLFKTYVVSEMLAQGYLAGPTLYAVTPHENHLERYVDVMAGILDKLSELGNSGARSALGDQRIATGGFARLA